MFPFVLLLFIAVPVVEIYLFITVGGWIGTLPTIAIVIVTAVIGVTLLRRQGLHTIQRAQASMSRGQAPAMEMMEGLVLVFLAALLLTPGFFTDALGFLGLIPGLRRAVIAGVISRGAASVWASSSVTGNTVTPHSPASAGQPAGFEEHLNTTHSDPKSKGRTLEGEYRREE